MLDSTPDEFWRSFIFQEKTHDNTPSTKRYSNSGFLYEKWLLRKSKWLCQQPVIASLVGKLYHKYRLPSKGNNTQRQKLRGSIWPVQRKLKGNSTALGLEESVLPIKRHVRSCNAMFNELSNDITPIRHILRIWSPGTIFHFQTRKNVSVLRKLVTVMKSLQNHTPFLRFYTFPIISSIVFLR